MKNYELQQQQIEKSELANEVVWWMDVLHRISGCDETCDGNEFGLCASPLCCGVTLSSTSTAHIKSVQ